VGQGLLLADYAGPAPLLSYTPGNPFSLKKNPQILTVRGANPSWRPMAMINGPDGNVYIGSVPGYGQLGSPLFQLNPKTDAVQQFGNIVANQSIVSLTAWKDYVIGGTSIAGGGGSHSTEKEAQLFVWNTKTQATEFAIVPVPGATQITDLTTSDSGLIFGIAGRELFIFDPKTRRITDRKTLPFSKPAYNSTALNSGKIWGLTEEGIFTIDMKTNEVKLIPSPVKITGGFAMKDNQIYFISDSMIYRYRL
jgi:hypothetical protein